MNRLLFSRARLISRVQSKRLRALAPGRSIERLESRKLLSGAVWTADASLPTALGGSTAISNANGVLVLGGTTGGANETSGVLQLNPSTNLSATAVAAMAQPDGTAMPLAGVGAGETNSFGPVNSDGYIYQSDIFVYGGASAGTPTNSVINYTVTNNNGQTGTPPSMATARAYFAHAVDASTGDLYAVGGLTTSNPTSATAAAERFDPVANSWSAIAPLPVALSYASGATDGAGHIFVFGGQTAAGTPVSTVYRYTIASDSWDSQSAMPVAVSDAAVVYGFYGSIFVAGGKSATGAVDYFYIYNPVLNTWTAQTPLPAPVYGAAGAIDYNSNLDLIGGYNSAGVAVNTVESTAVAASAVALPQPPTITIQAGYYGGSGYNGSAQPAQATVVGTDGITPVNGTVTFTYNGSSTPPVNVGTYTVIARFTSADSNYVDGAAVSTFTIYTALPTLTVTGGGTFTYNGQPHPITATAVGVDGHTLVAGTYAYTYNGSSIAPTTWGSYTAVATFTSSDPNYSGVSDASTPVKITIPDPRIVTGVTATAVSTTSLSVSWNPVTLPTGAAPTYNVSEQIYHRGTHNPKGSGGTPGYYTYTLVGSGITSNSLLISNLATTVSPSGSHSYVVNSVDSSTTPIYTSISSAVATGTVAYAPSFVYTLWGGALMSQASVEVGHNIQITAYFYGNPSPVYSLVNAPSSMVINPATGIISYTPVLGESGNVGVTIVATNFLGSASAPFSFTIIQQPTVVVTGGTFTFDGNTHSATAVASDIYGQPVAGTFSFQYAPVQYPNIYSSSPYAEPGTYNVLATFTSSVAGYGTATGTGTVTIIDPSTVRTLTIPIPAAYFKLGPDYSTLDVWYNSTGVGTIDQQIPLSNVSALVINGLSTGTVLTIDFSNNNPLPANGLTFNGLGAASGNSIVVVGSAAANDSVVASAGQIIVNGSAINYANVGAVSFIAGTGTDAVTVNGSSLTLPAGNSGGIHAEVFSSLNIGAGGTLVVATPTDRANRAIVNAASLNIAGSIGAWTGTLDLGGNDLILGNTALTAATSLATLTDQLSSGFNGGLWNGTGVDSSAAASDPAHLMALGMIPNTAGGPFENQPADANAILLKYTYFGDANLDGQVDGSDYTKIDNGFNNHLSGWSNGSFNYHGIVDGSDYTLIDNAFNTQGATFAATIASPTAKISTQAFAIPTQIFQSQTPSVNNNLPGADDEMLKNRRAIHRR